MKKKWKKVSAFFLVLAMVLNLSGIVVLAADPEEPRVEVGEAFAEDPEGEDTPEAIEEIIPEEVSSEAEAGSEEQLEQKDVSEGLSVDVDSVLAEQPEENSLSEDPVGDAVPFLSEQPEEESFAAGEIPVGDMSGIYVGDPASGSSSPYLPEFSYYNYSMTQQIYLADEIECSGTISSLTFYKMKGVGVGRTRTVEFYLRHTDKESFDEKTDWVPMTADDLVYEGNLVIPAGNGRENGRVTVQLDKPFEYNGTDNLLLCCYDKTGTYVGNPPYFQTTSTGDDNRALRIYQDGSPYNPSNPSSYSGVLLAERNNLGIGIELPPEPEVSPEFMSYSVTLGAQIGLNFFIDLPEIEGVSYEGSYVDFSVDHGEAAGRKVIDPEDKNAKGYYRFTADLNVLQMAEKVTAAFHYQKDGEDRVLTDTRSIEDYVKAFEKVRGQEAYSGAADLVDALADYGHYAQMYFADKNGWEYGVDYAAMDTFHSNPYTQEQINDAVQGLSAYGIKVQKQTDDISSFGMSLTWDSKTNFNLYIYPQESYAGTISAIVRDGAQNMRVRVRKAGTGRYQVSAMDISAHHLGSELDFDITTTSGDSTITASALYYVKEKLGDGSAASAERDAMVAVYRYYKAADQYVNG